MMKRPSSGAAQADRRVREALAQLREITLLRLKESIT